MSYLSQPKELETNRVVFHWKEDRVACPILDSGSQGNFVSETVAKSLVDIGYSSVGRVVRVCICFNDCKSFN